MELQKGQKVKIGDLTANNQIELKVSVPIDNEEIDISCFGVDAQNKLSDDRYFVFYNQLHTPENAVSMKIDKNMASFFIDFKKIPAFIKKLVITVAADGNTTMKDIKKGEFSVLANQQRIANFVISGENYEKEKAIILAEIYEKDGIWRLSLVSSGFNGGLSALLAYFGGEEIKEPVKSDSFKSEIKSPSFSAANSTVKNTTTSQTTPVNLKKRGDSHKISLEKNAKEIHVNLNWNTNAGKKKGLFGFGSTAGIDLDLACMYRLKTGHQGVIQALGNSFGSANTVPYIFLDQDDRTGQSVNGENMWFKKPELIEFAIVFAYIYEGTPNWQDTNARVVLKQPGEAPIEIFIDNPDHYNQFCVIASLTAKENQLEVKREERFFRSHREVDNAYGFGFRWVAGHK
ncbi:MAG: tellurium resistance protein [Lachnospiraceae bacterium]|jgi:tellurite resistance protein TerA|nr:tellurium resistance protein [Lachnospiraceae bacterium]